ncbi:hypothetical protein [Brevundimonas sp. P7753]|uniref:hypothetical protein n=1 Tax=Brevundimonas sp. P7753 TaxID=2726982 RepID=UPI0015BB7CB5|nr:hypothetical protein [Brevundimonas sp. P7753]NWE53765.1 hypothetical protein [Brevundimonas sp. P7753]
MKKTSALIAFTALLAACGSQADSKAPETSETAPATTSAQQTPSTEPVSAAEEEAARRGSSSQAAFPVGYRGAWDYSENGCAKDESGTRFVITANEIKGYEDTSKLVALETLEGEGDAIRVVLENQSSDGDKTIVQILRLSPVAGISLRIEQDGKTVRANRCDPV